MADDTVTVTQADRDAAARAVGQASWAAMIAEPHQPQVNLAQVLAGHFADYRHRLATEAHPASTVPSDVVEELREAIEVHRGHCVNYVSFDFDLADRILAALSQGRDGLVEVEWARGTRVTKIKGSSWTGKVVGFYSTDLTPEGYAVESENEPGSVQIYPRAALREARS